MYWNAPVDSNSHGIIPYSKLLITLPWTRYSAYEILPRYEAIGCTKIGLRIEELATALPLWFSPSET